MPNGTPSISKAFEPFLPWATQLRADELAVVYPNGQFIYTGEMERRWVALLQRWRAANQALARSSTSELCETPRASNDG